MPLIILCHFNIYSCHSVKLGNLRMWKYHIELHILVLIWGFTSILGALITVSSVEIVFYRSVISAFILFIIILFRNKVYLILHLERRILAQMFLNGVIIAIHWILFFISIKISKISICLAGIASTSLFTAFIEPLASGRKIRLLEVTTGLLVIGGLYTIFHFEFDHLQGLILALISALMAAIFSVWNSFLIKEADAQVISFYEMVGVIFSCTCYVFFFYTGTENSTILSEIDQLRFSWTRTDWIYIPILAIICTAYPFYISIQLLKNFSAFYINLITNLEPIYGIILALFIFGEKEQMTLEFYLGTGSILFIIAGYTLAKKIEKIRNSTNKKDIMA